MHANHLFNVLSHNDDDKGAMKGVRPCVHITLFDDVKMVHTLLSKKSPKIYIYIFFSLSNCVNFSSRFYICFIPERKRIKKFLCKSVSCLGPQSEFGDFWVLIN